MADDAEFADADIPDAIEDTEQYEFTENPDAEIYEIEMENPMEFDSEVNYSEEQTTDDTRPEQTASKSDISRITRLPISRIKNIMKMDPDVNIVSQDAAFLVTKATEMFLEVMAKETLSVLQKNKKTINKKELDIVINKIDSLCFLEGAMDF